MVNNVKQAHKVNENTSIYIGDNTNGLFRPNHLKEDNGLFGKSQENSSKIDAKRDEIKNRAMKILRDQLARDLVANDALKESEDIIKDSQAELKRWNDEIGLLRQSQASMREEYGISEDSQEHQDLELIRKGRKALANGSLSDLSEEELDKLSDLDMDNLTFYQEKCLQDDALEGVFSGFAKEAQDAIEAATSDIYYTKQGMLKLHGMADALASKEIVDAAGADEIIGMLVADARKHMEEELEKLVEAAKKAAEEKAEQKEKIEEAKAEREEVSGAVAEEDTAQADGQILESESDMDKVQQEISKILKDAELLEEDQKGLLVDKQL